MDLDNSPGEPNVPRTSLLGMILGAGRRWDTSRWWEAVVGAVRQHLRASSFCSTGRASSLRVGKERKKRTHRPFTITFAIAPETGSEEPGDARVQKEE